MVQGIETLFIKHLYNFGFLTGKTITDVITTYANFLKTTSSQSQPHNTNDISLFKTIMCSTLKHFFSALTEEQTEEISLNLISKYFEHTSFQKQNKLHSLILLLHTKLKSFHHLLLMKSLFKWKQKKQQAPPPPPSIIIPSDFNSSFGSKAIIPSNNNSGFVDYNKIKQNKINMNTHYKTNNTNVSTKIKLTKKKGNRSVSSIEEKSWDRRERESLEECTFNPVINQKYNARNKCIDSCKNNTKPHVFERLYKDKERYDTRKQIKLIEIEHFESNENTFRPNVNNYCNSLVIGNKAYDVSVSNCLSKTKSNNKGINNDNMVKQGTMSRSFIHHDKLEEVYKNYKSKKKIKGKRSNSVIIDNNKGVCAHKENGKNKKTYETIGEYQFILDNDKDNIPGSEYIERFFLNK